MGTDGSDYVHSQTGERIPYMCFYTQQVHGYRMAALSGNQQAFKEYQNWFNNLIDMLPSVYHYSWFDLERKITTYKNFWSKFWQSLYNIKQDDTAENNMFFDRPWSEVTEDDIRELAGRLGSEMGGWIFHQRVDFSKPTPHLTINNRSYPAVMDES